MFSQHLYKLLEVEFEFNIKPAANIKPTLLQVSSKYSGQNWN